LLLKLFYIKLFHVYLLTICCV